MTSNLQEVGCFKHINNIASIKQQLSTVQEVHNSIQTNIGQADQLHLDTGICTECIVILEAHLRAE